MVKHLQTTTLLTFTSSVHITATVLLNQAKLGENLLSETTQSHLQTRMLKHSLTLTQKANERAINWRVISQIHNTHVAKKKALISLLVDSFSF